MSAEDLEAMRALLDEMLAGKADPGSLARLLRLAARIGAHELVVETAAILLVLRGVDGDETLDLRSAALVELERHAEALADLDRLILTRPEARFIRRRADVHLALGQTAAGLADLDWALTLAEDAATLLVRARVRAENGRLEEARADIVRAQALGGDAIVLETAWFKLSGEAMRTFEVRAAEGFLDDALERLPTVRLFLARARARALRGDRAGAEADHAAAVALEPETVTRLEAEAGLTLSDDDDALAMKLGALEITPEAIGVLARLRAVEDPTTYHRELVAAALTGLVGHYLRGRAAFNAGLLADAERELDTARALAPDNGDVAELHTRVLIALGDAAADDDFAEACYTRAAATLDALEALPWLTYESRLMRAVLHERLGAIAEGEVVLAELSDTWPARAETFYIRACWHEQDDPAAARADFERAAALGSDEARRALADGVTRSER